MSKTTGEIEQKVKETEGKEEKEKEKLKEANKAMQQMMEQLAQRAKLQQKEKEDFYAKMGELSAEKDMAQRRIREIEEDRDRMRQQLMMMEEDMMGGSPEPPHPYIMDILQHPEIRRLVHDGVPTSVLKKYTRNLLAELPMQSQENLRDAGIIDRRNELTSRGIFMLRSNTKRLG